MEVRQRMPSGIKENHRFGMDIAIVFATSLLPPTMVDLKTPAKEQVEYMLTEDDDAP
ncbi:BTB/POZ domain-containing protein [Artemisia annua]|uniref:BTB/POZ domain-containing protein n=1 Tax=Artemisia annua TaxID=35608 RepID=A0A2U1KF60_ARTAN|nr:BTB/POZ domain-containing protein [Artemisia annua]